MNPIIKEFVTHYHEEHPHSDCGGVPLSEALENDARIAIGKPDDAMPDADEPKIVKFPERFGGLLQHDYREAVSGHLSTVITPQARSPDSTRATITLLGEPGVLEPGAFWQWRTARSPGF